MSFGIAILGNTVDVVFGPDVSWWQPVRYVVSALFLVWLVAMLLVWLRQRRRSSRGGR